MFFICMFAVAMVVCKEIKRRLQERICFEFWRFHRKWTDTDCGRKNRSGIQRRTYSRKPQHQRTGWKFLSQCRWVEPGTNHCRILQKWSPAGMPQRYWSKKDSKYNLDKGFDNWKELAKKSNNNLLICNKECRDIKSPALYHGIFYVNSTDYKLCSIRFNTTVAEISRLAASGITSELVLQSHRPLQSCYDVPADSA